MRDFWIVYLAETKRRLRSRAFQIGLVIGMLGVAGMIELPGFLDKQIAAGQRTILLAGEPALIARARPLLQSSYTIAGTRVSTAAPTAAELAAARAGALVAVERSASGLRATVYSTNPGSAAATHVGAALVPLSVQLATRLDAAQAARAVNVPVEVRGVGKAFASPQAALLARTIGFSLLVVLYLIVILNSQLTLTSVIEEKTNRIAELLVAAIDPLPLLYAKIFSGTTLAVVQMLAWVVVGALVGAHPSGQSLGAIGASGIKPAILPAFLFFLFVGLLQFSTIYAAIGSLVSRPEDLGSISSVLIFPIVAAFFTAIIALDTPGAPFVVGASFVPLIAPFVMFVRIVMGDPPLWQIALCAAINVVALGAIAIAAGRLYRVGMLLYGRPPSLAQIWQTVRAR